MHMFQRPGGARAALPVVLAAALGAARADAAGSAASIGADDVRDEVRFLASPELEGRGALTAGLARAADHLARQLAAAGLAPGGDQGTYFQAVEIPVGPRPGPGTRLALGGVPLSLGDEFSPNAGSIAARATGPLVFAGYGVVVPGRYDDFAGIDVRGKIVLCLRYAPGFDERSGGVIDPEFREAAALRRKVENAVARGAAGVLIVDPPEGPSPARAGDAGALPVGAGLGAAAIASFHVTPGAVDRLLARAAGPERTVAALQARIEATGRPASFDLPVFADFAITWSRPAVEGRNVVAVLEGADPALRAEAVLVGAHYDHLGRGDEGSALDGRAIHPGADDNASGTAALVEIARAFAAAGGPRPRRSVVFVAFTGEEKGMLGSAVAAAHPGKAVVAMLNLDMIGRLRGGALEVGGATTSPEWRAIVEAANTERLALTFPQLLVPNSDHAPFVARQIPALFMFTGMHGDYHRATDTADKVNAEGIAAIARLAARVVRAVADRPARLAFAPPQWTRGGAVGGGAGEPPTGDSP